MVHCKCGDSRSTSQVDVALRHQLEKFPGYATLTSPKALKAEEIQKLLRPDEALLFWLARYEGVKYTRS
jgi:hypothetical protein